MKIRILLIEDNEQNRYLATFLLERHGYAVTSAPDGQQGIEMAGKMVPELILLDIQLPIMDGYETTRRLRNPTDVSIDASLRKIPVIALTASAIKGDKERCEAAGMDDYITKPVAKQDLERILVRWALRT